MNYQDKYHLGEKTVCLFILDSLIMNISMFGNIVSVNILTHTNCTSFELNIFLNNFENINFNITK